MAEQQAPAQAEAKVAAESAAVASTTEAANKAGGTDTNAADGAATGAQQADPAVPAQKAELRASAAEVAVDHPPSVTPTDVDFGRPGNENRCGLFGFRPDCLQPMCRLPVVLADLSFVMLAHNFLTNGVISVVLPTLERRFQLKSFESAMILSSYNVANVLAVTPVSFMGSTRNKPMFVAFGVLTVGTGSLLFASAHLLAPTYEWGSEIPDLCPAGPLPEDLCRLGNIRNYRFLLMLAHAINGLGSTPFFTLSVTYLDENVPTRKVSTYLGTVSATSVLGPGIGFFTAGYFLSKYTDITRDVRPLGLTAGSAVWVGAWWVGFLMASLAMYILFLPTLCFPKHTKHYYELLEEKKRECTPGVHTIKEGRSFKELPKAVLDVLTNATFLCISLAGTADYMLTNAVTAFSTKFFESQFAITSTHAAAVLGAIAILGGCGGSFMGGYLVTRFNLTAEGIIKMCASVSLVPWLCIFMFRTYCNDPNFAVNIPAVQNGSNPFEFPCNSHCNCNLGVYNPVCSMDGTVFFSPCFAGCEVQLAAGGARMYTNCSCLTSAKPVTLKNGTEVSVQALRKKCNTGCKLLPYFTLAIFAALYSSFLNLAPVATVLLRVVPLKERSVALALKWIILRLLASIPGPVLVGRVIDRTCLVWQSLCGRSGSCLYYNNKLLAHNLFTVLILLKSLSILMYTLALIMYRRHLKGRKLCPQ